MLYSLFQENELLHDLFGFTPKKKYNLGSEHKMSTEEKVSFISSDLLL